MDPNLSGIFEVLEVVSTRGQRAKATGQSNASTAVASTSALLPGTAQCLARAFQLLATLVFSLAFFPFTVACTMLIDLLRSQCSRLGTPITMKK